VWRAHWDVKDSTQNPPRGYLEIIDSCHATWRLGYGLSKFSYRLIYSHGGVTSSEITYFSINRFNNQNLTTSAVLTRYSNDALKIEWLIYPKNDTSEFYNTVILVKEKHYYLSHD